MSLLNNTLVDYSGKILQRKYAVQNLLAKGRFGSVYYATEINSNPLNEFAIKVIDRERMKEQEKRLLKNEISALRQTNSPYIVKLIETFENETTTFLVLEYCNQDNLETFIQKNKFQRNPERFYKNLFSQILLAFKEIHNKRILHRDVKASNILVHNNTIKLGDFGLCKQLQPDEDVTQTHVGTQLTMAPEVLEYKPYGIESEIYSLGVLFYYIVKKSYPFLGSNPFQLLKNIKEGKVDYTGVTLELKELLSKMIRYDPKERIKFKDLFEHSFFLNEDECKFMNSSTYEEENSQQQQKMDHHNFYFEFEDNLVNQENELLRESESSSFVIIEDNKSQRYSSEIIKFEYQLGQPSQMQLQKNKGNELEQMEPLLKQAPTRFMTLQNQNQLAEKPISFENIKNQQAFGASGQMNDQQKQNPSYQFIQNQQIQQNASRPQLQVQLAEQPIRPQNILAKLPFDANANIKEMPKRFQDPPIQQIAVRPQLQNIPANNSNSLKENPVYNQSVIPVEKGEAHLSYPKLQPAPFTQSNNPIRQQLLQTNVRIEESTPTQRFAQIEDINKSNKKKEECKKLENDLFEKQACYSYIINAATWLIKLNELCEKQRMKFTTFIGASVLVLCHKGLIMNQQAQAELQKKTYDLLRNEFPLSYGNILAKLKSDNNTIENYLTIARYQYDESKSTFYTQFRRFIDDHVLPDDTSSFENAYFKHLRLILFDTLLDIADSNKVNTNNKQQSKDEFEQFLLKACKYLTLACLVDQPNTNYKTIENNLELNWQRECLIQLEKLIEQMDTSVLIDVYDEENQEDFIRCETLVNEIRVEKEEEKEEEEEELHFPSFWKQIPLQQQFEQRLTKISSFKNQQ